jgi:group I intron endonuclease
MQHEYSLNKNKHDNRHLQSAWNHYGSDAFEFEVIAVYPERTERDAAEQALIDEHYGPGCYNIMKKVRPERTTYSHTPEETRAKQSAAMKGKKHSPEHRAAIGAALKGKERSPEHRAALNAANVGKKHSPEACAAMSAARKGKKHSPEHRAAVIAANKGKKLSPEYRAAQSAALKGKKHTPEHRAALVAAWVKRREAKALLIDNKMKDLAQ